MTGQGRDSERQRLRWRWFLIGFVVSSPAGFVSYVVTGWLLGVPPW